VTLLALLLTAELQCCCGAVAAGYLLPQRRAAIDRYRLHARTAPSATTPQNR